MQTTEYVIEQDLDWIIARVERRIARQERAKASKAEVGQLTNCLQRLRAWRDRLGTEPSVIDRCMRNRSQTQHTEDTWAWRPDAFIDRQGAISASSAATPRGRIKESDDVGSHAGGGHKRES
jgi:hypothetical protein